MQLESTLAQFPLPELITMIISSSVTGCLDIGEVAGARMYFRDGKLYHAVCEGHTGTAAVCQLFTLHNAPFRFTAAIVADEETLWQDAWDLIEFAQRYAETWKRVQQHIPSFEAIPVLVETSASTVLINDASWKTLAAIDGQRSIEAIAEQIGQVPMEVAASLCDLIEQGVVRLLPGHGFGSGSRGVPSSSRGFFGRIMAATSEVSR